MQFQVPQFIETEAKIFGPFTLKQLIYVVVGGGFCAMLYFFLNFVLWIIITIPVGGLTLAIALFKYNGRPFPMLLKSVFVYYWEPRFYLWQRAEQKTPAIKVPQIRTAPSTAGGLKNLIFQLTTSTQAILARENPVSLAGVLGKLPGGAREKIETLRKSTGEMESVRRIDYR